MESLTYQIEAAVGATHWWFQARASILEDVIRQLPLCENPRIYDLGCGTGQNLVMLQRLGQATGVDLSLEALALARAQGCKSTLQGDLTNLPIPDATADLVVASDILEHLDHHEQGAAEIRRILKHDGRVVVTVPAFQFLWGYQDDVSHHKRRYTRRQLRQLLEGAGLEVQFLSYFNFWLFPAIWLGRLLLRGLGGAHLSENQLTPGWSNTILRLIFQSEAYWLRVGRFPFGVSLIAVARHPDEDTHR